MYCSDNFKFVVIGFVIAFNYASLRGLRDLWHILGESKQPVWLVIYTEIIIKHSKMKRLLKQCTQKFPCLSFII